MIAMSRANVKNGTPVGSRHLCKSCTWGHVLTGYRESDLVVMCTAMTPDLHVPFVVHECTGFNDKHKPTMDEMRRLALPVGRLRVSAKTTGFGLIETIRSAAKSRNESKTAEALDE